MYFIDRVIYDSTSLVHTHKLFHLILITKRQSYYRFKFVDISNSIKLIKDDVSVWTLMATVVADFLAGILP